MRFEVVIEGRARPKGSMQRGKYGGVFDRPEVREWVSECEAQARRAFKRSGLPQFQASCNVRLMFHMLPAKSTGIIRADLDKLVRGVLDAFTRAEVWADDVLVQNLSASKLALQDGQEERVECLVNIPT